MVCHDVVPSLCAQCLCGAARTVSGAMNERTIAFRKFASRPFIFPFSWFLHQWHLPHSHRIFLTYWAKQRQKRLFQLKLRLWTRYSVGTALRIWSHKQLHSQYSPLQRQHWKLTIYSINIFKLLWIILFHIILDNSSSGSCGMKGKGVSVMPFSPIPSLRGTSCHHLALRISSLVLCVPSPYCTNYDAHRLTWKARLY